MTASATVAPPSLPAYQCELPAPYMDPGWMQSFLQSMFQQRMAPLVVPPFTPQPAFPSLPGHAVFAAPGAPLLMATPPAHTVPLLSTAQSAPPLPAASLVLSSPTPLTLVASVTAPACVAPSASPFLTPSTVTGSASTSSSRHSRKSTKQRCRSYKHHSDSSEGAFVPIDEDSSPEINAHLGLRQVPERMSDRLSEVAPSPVPGIEKRDIIWSDPTSIPPDPMIKDLITTLDEDFATLSLTPSIKVPRFRKDDFPIHALEVADLPHTLDEDLLTSSSKPATLCMLDTCLAFIETEIRCSLKPLSALASSLRAISRDLSENNLNRINHLHTVMTFQQRQTEHMSNLLKAMLAEITSTRRLGYLALLEWDSEFKRRLLRQPWSASSLFNGEVSNTHSRVSDYARDETALKALEQVSKNSALKVPRVGNYQPGCTSLQPQSSQPCRGRGRERGRQSGNYQPCRDRSSGRGREGQAMKCWTQRLGTPNTRFLLPSILVPKRTPTSSE
ncbi:uncharacterized protein LOC124284989 isoform X2 [Haliotis rubra]|uniref:uncharacterized protein LOC124284989 isoform X2 n=1 Tax=Haliotis rubra TaxID=36100 RepID=UPI001EE4ED0E|nr:uncharacterized protein LOC124284989 isoform X2 [Haliotis rubra]